MSIRMPAAHNLRRREVVGGTPGSTDVDILNRKVLDEMLTSPAWVKVGAKCGEREKEEMIQTWHKIDGALGQYPILSALFNIHSHSAWPDSSAGLKALKKKVIIATLSNGTTRLLINLVRLLLAHIINSACSPLSGSQE
jgi:FMN phosphatase YigB (HAD superfamily)